ncbi:Tyrosinase [Madurella mycetomatis]|uniref:tyrosinase n=1 Tax=Madurella mycetomatis TaxID=100816 RepID=A0A175VT74_9PEZI|nr:Tyrosinase [Madurella mycetomatis]KXX74718.1 Tyrosinase [Madurella mycetomatis]
MSDNISITGIPTTAGPGEAVPLRRELRDLQWNYPDQFNLLILGLKNLEGQDQSKLTSYYQIAGIHGMPYKPWNGVGSQTNWQTTSGFGGYCTHSSILFLTWHRPYLALYEQSLYNAVQEVAQQFPEGDLRDRYVAAAKDFRAPYFDWASQPPRGSSAFPSVLSLPSIQIVDIDGRAKLTSNPLHRFDFDPANVPRGDLSAQWSRFQSTVRHPNRFGQSQDSRIAPILANELASLRSNIGLLLLSYTNFDAFSYNRWDPNTRPGEFGSLEDVHNEIHDRAGGGGHMSSLDVSSFDPFFWLHHANVDRLWAIWQELHPDTFMSPRQAPYSTFNATGGEVQTADTPLAPFWDKSGSKFWTSAEIKDTTTFGYAYPETQQWQYPDYPTYQAAIRRAVTALYGTNVFVNFVANVEGRRKEHTVAVRALAAAPDRTKDDDAPVEANGAAIQSSVAADENDRAGEPPAAAALASTPFISTSVASIFPTVRIPADAGPIPAPLKHLAPSNRYTDWIVNVRAQKHGLGQPFRVIVFLGPFDESDPAGWDMEFNCVGRVSVLARGGETTQCAKCHVDAADELMVSGTVPLTSALLQDIMEDEDSGLTSLRPEEVVPYLREKLTWKVTLFDGEERDVAAVPGLKVSVASTEVTIDEEDGLPDYSDEYTIHAEVTEGKPAGLRAGEHI